MYHAIAIDLGTTSIKCSGLKADGEFEVLLVEKRRHCNLIT